MEEPVPEKPMGNLKKRKRLRKLNSHTDQQCPYICLLGFVLSHVVMAYPRAHTLTTATTAA